MCSRGPGVAAGERRAAGKQLEQTFFLIFHSSQVMRSVYVEGTAGRGRNTQRSSRAVGSIAQVVVDESERGHRLGPQ